LPLLPPTVIGPISVCNSSVRVQGQNVGSTVQLFQTGNPAPIGGGVATLSDQVFGLNGGIQLAAGQSVTATQTQSGSTSPPSPSPVQVQSRPPSVGAVACATHVYQCGQSLSLLGMVPGATAQVTVAGSSRGQGTSADGTVQINLSEPTQPSDTLMVTQTACGVSGPPLALPQPDNPPVTPQGQLAGPALSGPLYACQNEFEIGGVVDGALVTLTETPGSSTSILFPLPSGLLTATNPLVAGGSVSVTQTMEAGCQIGGAVSSPIQVSPTAPVPPPTVAGPLCAGSVVVLLGNLIPGAQVEIFESGVSLGTGTCSAPAQYFSIPALAKKKEITATQSLCSVVSAVSNQVKVGKAVALGKPAVQKKLFQCGSIVQVSNLQPGAIVYVYSTQLGAPIGIAPVIAPEMNVQVAPLLATGDQIYATQIGCGEISHKSAAITVQPLPNQGAPSIVAPVGSGSSSVLVQNLVAGSRVDVYVNNVFRGTATATGPAVEVQLSPPLLNVGDQVSVIAATCEGTQTGITVTVTGCQCTQVGKAPLQGGQFLYTFNCMTPGGTVETVQVTASDDNDALQMAELGCDQQYGA
jgi:hypothetical protein